MGAIRTVCDEMAMPSQPRPLLAMRKLALPLVGTAAKKLAPTLAEELASAIGRDGPTPHHKQGRTDSDGTSIGVLILPPRLTSSATTQAHN